MADESFIRSLYIGRDKIAEVTKRREAVEAELKSRREAKILLQNERLNRAAQQKEAVLIIQTRKKHEKDLIRQKAVLDRRYAQFEKEKAKKAEILLKAHNSASRTAQMPKKPLYVFGSSTPRELTYLEKLAAAPKNGSMLTSASTTRGNSATPPVRIPSRIVPRAMGLTSNAMTRSVFGTLNNEIKPRIVVPPRNKNYLLPSYVQMGSTPTLKKNSATNSASSILSGAAMTQSLYSSRSKPNMKFKKDTLKETPFNNKNVQLQPKSTARRSEDNKADNKPPVICPRKALLNNQLIVQKELSNKIIIEKTLEANLNSEKSPKLEELVDPEISEEKLKENQEEINLFLKKDKQRKLEKETNCKLNVDTLIDLQNENCGNLPIENDSLECISDKQQKYTSEKALIDDIFENLKIEQQKKEEEKYQKVDTPNSEEHLNNGFIISDSYPITSNVLDTKSISMRNGHEISYGLETLPLTPIISSISATSSIEEIPVSVNNKILVNPIVFASEASKQAEQERENRRQRLNEILQRTRDQNASTLLEPKITSNLSNSTLLDGINASALAQDLLAQRRLQKLQQQQIEKNLTAQQLNQPPSLAAEFNGVGYFNEERTSILPGQIIPDKSNFLRKNIQEKKSFEKPPDDPHNNNCNASTKTTNGQRSFSPDSPMAI